MMTARLATMAILCALGAGCQMPANVDDGAGGADVVTITKTVTVTVTETEVQTVTVTQPAQTTTATATETPAADCLCNCPDGPPANHLSVDTFCHEGKHFGEACCIWYTPTALLIGKCDEKNFCHYDYASLP